MNERNLLRLFVAIRLPEEVKAALETTQEELRALLPPHSGSWTRTENMHLTMRFLGNVDLARLDELQQRLRVTIAGFGTLDLICERLGCFPDLRFPRVVWAWVRDADERLQLLSQHVESAVSPFAEKSGEERFTGHVTIARCKRIPRSTAQTLARFVEQAADRTFGAWCANEVELIQSELSSTGSRYSTLAKVDLRAPNPE